MSFTPDVLVVVPTYNERQNLPALVSGVLDIPRAGLLIVDDQSPDGTGALAGAIAVTCPSRVRVLNRTGPRGYGRASIDGLTCALESGAPLICQMDGDLSHATTDLPMLIAATVEADLVIGSRYVPGGRIAGWPLSRHVLSRGANAYVRRLTGLPAWDCTSGFRCWRREGLARLPLGSLTSDGYAFLVETLWYAVATGCRVLEVPITFTERRAGASKLSRRVIVESALLPWRLRTSV